jgi:hypothetical protein
VGGQALMRTSYSAIDHPLSQGSLYGTADLSVFLRIQHDFIIHSRPPSSFLGSNCVGTGVRTVFRKDYTSIKDGVVYPFVGINSNSFEEGD